MIQDNVDRFTKWLDSMELETGLTDNKVSERGKFSPAVLSKLRSQGKIPGFGMCVKIAFAFHVDAILVLREAGWLPIPAEFDPEYELTKDWYDLLTLDEKGIIRKVLWHSIENRIKKEEGKRRG